MRKCACGLSLMLLLTGMAGFAQKTDRSNDKESGEKKARALIEQSIQALGGKAYTDVRDIKSSGLFYQFRKGANSAGVPYQDYTRLPNKSRYEEGNKKKDKEVSVFNLDANKGWILEGRKGVREVRPEELDQFKKTVKHAVENLLRTRYKEPGMKLFYFGPEEVIGKVRTEVVELLDPENDSVLIYFDEKTHLPIKLEYTEVTREGRKSKVEEEYSNWHVIQGVETPLRIDVFTDGEQSARRHIERISYNDKLPDSLFDKPVPEK